jgi:hypothetical protein
MPLALAQWIVALLTLYASIGALFSLVFATFGVGRVDVAARGASLRFRVLILPGVAALWPLMLRRWVSAEPPPARRTAT